MNEFIIWLEQNQQPCLYKKHLNFDCPGCGMQTAFIELLKGNFVESIYAYPALIPMIILFLTLSLYLMFKFKYGSVILKYWFIFTVIITIVSYLFKISY